MGQIRQVFVVAPIQPYHALAVLGWQGGGSGVMGSTRKAMYSNSMDYIFTAVISGRL